MKVILFLLFSLNAGAALLSPMAELSCRSGDRTVEFALNDERSNTLSVKKKSTTIISCSVGVAEIRSFIRGPQKVKTFYLDTKLCTGQTNKEKFSPVLPSGMVVFSGNKKLDVAELHMLENSQALRCRIKSIQQKRIDKFALPKAIP